MDSLSELLNHTSINAEVFFSGNLCGVQAFGGAEGGHLHILQSGLITVITDEGHKVVLDKPSVIFIPSASQHRVISSESLNAKLVCAAIKFDTVSENRFIGALPKFIYFTIEQDESAGVTAQWLFAEAFANNSGRQIMLDRLVDIFLLQILRHVMAQGLLANGMIAALSHPQLAAVIKAINEQPEKSWSLEVLAQTAAMSRSKFAAFFRETVGQTPNDYITDVRIAKAQNLLKLDRPVNLVANEVGYEHGSALARVFKKKLGLSPKEWLHRLKIK